MQESPVTENNRFRRKRPVLALVVGMSILLTGVAQAFPSLNLTAGTPDLASSFISVDYGGTNAGGFLTATGFANVLTPPGSPVGNIANGSFDINADINFNAQTATGALAIGGTIAGLGFTSGTLLTGTMNSTVGNEMFGAGSGDPLEFLFDITGGDAAGIFGSTAGVILSQSGYTGSFASDFTSGPLGALADTFPSQQQVSEPITLTLLGLGIAGVGYQRRKKSMA